VTAGEAVRELDPADPATGAAIVELQRVSYAVEAELIGSDGIPALTETLEAVRATGWGWLGVVDDAGLCGAIAWDELDDGTIDICRLVVAPRAFRRGVASRLLDALDERFPTRAMLVSTGRDNEPAVTLYRRRGFHQVADREAAPGLFVTELRRGAQPPRQRPAG
jgi:ribosomal protein S18 acetylase RimI-like enzyme